MELRVDYGGVDEIGDLGLAFLYTLRIDAGLCAECCMADEADEPHDSCAASEGYLCSCWCDFADSAQSADHPIGDDHGGGDTGEHPEGHAARSGERLEEIPSRAHGDSLPPEDA